MISYKPYRCPACSWTTSIQTNHDSEVYSGCKNCHSMILYCDSETAIEARSEFKFIQTRLKQYRFDIEYDADLLMYNALLGHLLVLKYEVFRWSGKQNHEYWAGIGGTNYSLTRLYTHQIFDDQWITDRGRLRDWAEQIYPNKSIKHGYFLLRTQEMISIRKKSFLENKHYSSS